MQELLSQTSQCVARDFSFGVGINPGAQKEGKKRFKGKQAHSFVLRKKKPPPRSTHRDPTALMSAAVGLPSSLLLKSFSMKMESTRLEIF